MSAFGGILPACLDAIAGPALNTPQFVNKPHRAVPKRNGDK